MGKESSYISYLNDYMEGKPVMPRSFRSEAEISRLLQEQADSGQSVKTFCALNKIQEGSFYRWRNKHSKIDSPSSPSGFAALQIIPEPVLFAAVGSIRIYQSVSAAYLKELVS
jgi:hypothetical protein